MDGSGPRSVVVIGGGAIGLLCAYYLRRSGADVTVLERDRIGRGCSWGNLGWVCPSISTPLPAPGLTREALRSFLDPDSPLYIAPASLPRLARWLLRFRQHCNADDFAAGCAALASLNASTLRLYDELAADGVAFERVAAGLTFVAAEEAALREEAEAIATVGAARPAEWSPDELAEREPGLPGSFAGALHVSSDRHVRADTLCRGVAERLAADGARIREGIAVDGFAVEGGRAVAATGPAGPVEADAFVIATGVEASRLTGSLGAPLPLQAGKGYTLTVHDPELRLNAPLYLCDAKIGLTPYRDALRIGGTMELSGSDPVPDPRRLAAIRRAVSAILPNALDGSRVDEWMGRRPLTPDGLPAIGALPGASNAFVATGHQMLGITLAPGTGRAVASLILEGRSDVDLRPFAPSRFA